MIKTIFSFFSIILFSFSAFSSDSEELIPALKERSALLNSSFIHNVGYNTDEDSFSGEESSGSEQSSVPAIKTFNGVPEIKVKKSHTLFDLLVNVKELLDSGVPAARVGVTLDLDGTITKNPDPQESPNLPVEERDHAGSILKKLEEWGVFMTISSAWSPFGETLDRINKVGLGWMIQGEQIQGTMCIGQNILSYVKKGCATSVRVLWSSDPFYRRKDLALFFADMEKSSALEYVFFPDDSAANTRSFRDSLKGEHPYPNLASVTTHYITTPSENEGVGNLLPRIQELSLSPSNSQKFIELGLLRKELLARPQDVTTGDENSENLSTQ